MAIKPLATWKTWWTSADAASIAAAIHSNLDSNLLPGHGNLVTLKSVGRVGPADLDDSHTGRILQALLDSYPVNKDPSGYLLGDSIMHLNVLMGETLLGGQKANPFEERNRRDCALKQGAVLKLLLSYTRNSSNRTTKGRSPNVTFLKELAGSKGRVRKGSPSPSTSSTASGETLMLEGIPLHVLDDESPQSSSSMLIINLEW